MSDSSFLSQARRCNELFAAGSFDSCLHELRRLKAMKEDDIRILHNIAICHFHKSECSQPTRLLAELKRLKSVADAKSLSDDGETAAPDEVDWAVLHCNVGLMAMQLNKYATAVEALERLFRNLEPLEELLAFRVCLIYLDCLYFSKQAEKASQVVSYLDRSVAAFCSSRVTAANGSASTNDASVVACTPTGSVDADPVVSSPANGEGGGAGTGVAGATELCRYGFRSLDDLRARVCLYKARHFIAIRSVKVAKREIKVAAALGAAAAAAAGQSARFHDSILMLKAQVELQRGNSAKCQRLLSAVTDPSTLPLQLNNLACVSHRMRDYGAATFFLMKAARAIDTAAAAARTSARARVGADGDEAPAVRPDGGGGGPGPGAAAYQPVWRRREELSYSLGLHHLLQGRPDSAFACLTAASRLFYNQPRLWLRLSECCIAKQAQLAEEAERAFQSHLVRAVAGRGPRRRVLLPFGISSRRGLMRAANPSHPAGKEQPASAAASLEELGSAESLSAASGGDGGGGSSSGSGLPNGAEGGAGAGALGGCGRRAVPALTYEYALTCLYNALILISRPADPSPGPLGSWAVVAPSGHAGHPDDAEPAAGVAAQTTAAREAWAREGREREERRLLTHAAHTALAFVCLCLDDPVRALAAARQVLEVSDGDGAGGGGAAAHPGHRYLARTYAAEALCALQRPAAAADMLAPLILPHGPAGDGGPLAAAADCFNGAAAAGAGDGAGDDGWVWRGHGQAGRRLYSGPGWWQAPPAAGTPAAAASAGSGAAPAAAASGGDGGEAWRAARGAALSNLAAVHAACGQLAAARRAAKRALDWDPRSPHGLLLAVYLEMRQGNSAAALAILRRRRAALLPTTSAAAAAASSSSAAAAGSDTPVAGGPAGWEAIARREERP